MRHGSEELLPTPSGYYLVAEGVTMRFVPQFEPKEPDDKEVDDGGA